MYTDTGNDGDGFSRKKIVKGREMEVRKGAKIFVCCDEVADEHVFAITVETWLTGKREEVEQKREMEEVTKTGFK